MRVAAAVALFSLLAAAVPVSAQSSTDCYSNPKSGTGSCTSRAKIGGKTYVCRSRYSAFGSSQSCDWEYSKIEQSPAELAKLCALMLPNWKTEHAATVQKTCAGASQSELQKRGVDMALVAQVIDGEGVRQAPSKVVKGGICDDGGGALTVPEFCKGPGQTDPAK